VKIFVSVIDTKGKKSTFALRQKPIVIGRSTKDHVTVADDLASSIHCSIYVKDRQVFVEDQQSKNGLYLNGIKVFKQRIYIDDKVKIGNSFLSFEKDRMELPMIKLLTAKESGNRIPGEARLELETSRLESQTRKVLKDKLYEGVEDTHKKLNLTPMQERLLSIRERIAGLIDFILALIMIPIPFVSFYQYDLKNFNKMFILDKNQVNWDSLGSVTGLVLLGSSFVLFVIFHTINRKKLQSSLGEKILGLN
jgi:pSer/pThr/pTyr-binding forkhead associated (FHA) protein